MSSWTFSLGKKSLELIPSEILCNVLCNETIYIKAIDLFITRGVFHIGPSQFLLDNIRSIVYWTRPLLYTQLAPVKIQNKLEGRTNLLGYGKELLNWIYSVPSSKTAIAIIGLYRSTVYYARPSLDTLKALYADAL